MHRDDDSRFLLFIEPTIEQRSEIPMDDEYVQLMRMVVNDAQFCVSNYDEPGVPEVKTRIRRDGAPLRYKGVHTNCDDIQSANYDLLLPNGMVTNTLCIHYLRFYRVAIPISDWKKLEELQRFYGRNMDVQAENLKKIK